MKNLILIFTLLLSMNTFAQNAGDYIDVLHFKDGTIVKGLVLEQVFGKTVSIQTQDGELLTYQLSEIEKVNKELDMSSAKVRAKVWMKDYRALQKGYSFDAEALMGQKGGGFRIYNGYKFSQFGMLSLGVGFEVQTVRNPQIAKPMLTLNLAYGGEILKKRITPFYQVELGYGYVLERKGIEIVKENSDPFVNGSIDFDGLDVLNYGGPMGSLAFGIKIKTKKKIFYKLTLDSRVTSNFYDATPINVSELDVQTIIGDSFKGFDMFSALGVRFGIGF